MKQNVRCTIEDVINLLKEKYLKEGEQALCNDYEGVNLWAGDDLYWACITGQMPWLENRLAPQEAVMQEEAKNILTN